MAQKQAWITEDGTYGVRADWAEAADEIEALAEDGWAPTGRQVANFRHSQQAALVWVLSRVAIDSGDDEETANKWAALTAANARWAD